MFNIQNFQVVCVDWVVSFHIADIQDWHGYGRWVGWCITSISRGKKDNKVVDPLVKEDASVVL